MSEDMPERFHGIPDSAEMRAFDYAGRIGILMGAMRSVEMKLRHYYTTRTNYVPATLVHEVVEELARALEAEQRADAVMTAQIVQAGSPVLNRPLRTEAEVVALRVGAKPRVVEETHNG